MPNANYIPPARVLACIGARVELIGTHVGLIGTRFGYARLFTKDLSKNFRYQYVGKGNAKSSRWGSKPTRGPKASGFALQWNIGFSFYL